MSEEQELQVSKLIDKEVEIKRRVAWGEFGVVLYHGEIALQLRAQEINSKLIEPKTTQQIKEAEQALALVKKEYIALVEERKDKYTARFNSVAKRLMQPEQSIEEAIKANEAALIKAKQTEKEELKTTENKDKELKAIAEHVRLYVADMHAAYLKAQAKLISDAYKYAVDTKIPVDQIEAYVGKVSARINLANRTTPAPKPAFKYNTQEDIDAEVTKHFKPWAPQQYVDGFAIDIKNKFADWELALKNPEQALKLNDDEEGVTILAIEDNKEKETVSAKLEAIAMPLTEEPAGKSLKQVWKIVEPETIEEAFFIINAFTVNKKACVPELNKVKPVNLGVKQMISALEGVKNKDAAFEVTGIKFIQVEKL